MVTPLVELPSVLCDVVEILEGAVRVVTWSLAPVSGQRTGSRRARSVVLK